MALRMAIHTLPISDRIDRRCSEFQCQCMELFGVVCQKGLASVITGTLIGCRSSDIKVVSFSPGCILMLYCRYK